MVSNAVVVGARGHDWIALLHDGSELVRELSGSPEATFVVEPGTYVVVTDGRIEDAEAGAIDLPPDPLSLLQQGELFFLRLTADAPDQHVLDGVGEIPADGKSSCTITIEKHDPAGEPLRRRKDDDEIFLRTTGGTIVAEKGTARIRSVKLRSGRAAFRLVSEPAPRLVTVSALGAGGAAPAELQLEFV
jgi:hypothetical protein